MVTRAGSPYSKAAYQRDRAAMLAEEPFCVHCRRRVAQTTDHQPPLSLHDHVDGSGCCVLVPSCWPCARSQGGRLAHHPLNGRVSEPIVEPASISHDDPCWRVSWLEDLLEVPGNATWPRFMTAPHPDAVGSYGALVEAWSLGERGRTARWFQRLFWRRLLEHDAAGSLVWLEALLTVARQVGKTWGLSDECGWRLNSAELFDAEQLVLSTGKDVAVAREMQRFHRLRAKRDRERFHVREVNGQEEIEVVGDGSRWMVRAKEAVYGITATSATVDEAWKVPPSVVDDGIEPTTVESPDTQIVLVSTAHRRATGLMVGRRVSALEHLRDGEGPLILEWSAPPHAELEDRGAWRMASPHWSAKRERLIERRLAAALAGESEDPDEPDPLASFRTQWLNQWPARRVRPVKGDELVDMDAWAALTATVSGEGPLWIGVEDNYGQGAGVAAAIRLADGRIGLDAWLAVSWDDAIADVRALRAGHARSRLWVGASIVGKVPLDLRASKAGAAETLSGLPLLRQLVASSQVVHDDTPDLDAQLSAVRVAKASGGGLAIVTGTRTDLLRAACWVLQAAHRPVRVPMVH